MEPCMCCASGMMVPIPARTPSVRKSCERRSTPAPDGRSSPSNRTGFRPDTTTTAHRPGWRPSDGSSLRTRFAPVVPSTYRRPGIASRLYALPRPRWFLRYFVVLHIHSMLGALDRRYSSRAALGLSGLLTLFVVNFSLVPQLGVIGWHRVNRELRDLGYAHGSSRLGHFPALSAMAYVMGTSVSHLGVLLLVVIAYAPAWLAWQVGFLLGLSWVAFSVMVYRTHRRVRRAYRASVPAARSLRRGLRRAVLSGAAALLFLLGALVAPLLVWGSPAAALYFGFLQGRLNKTWARQGTPMSPPPSSSGCLKSSWSVRNPASCGRSCSPRRGSARCRRSRPLRRPRVRRSSTSSGSGSAAPTSSSSPARWPTSTRGTPGSRCASATSGPGWCPPWARASTRPGWAGG